MGCCGPDDDPNKLESYEEDRSCTDVLFLLIFVAFWVGFVVIAGIAFKNGDPYKLLYGTDYLGYTCGRGDAPPGFAASIPATSTFQSKTWEDNNYLWVPLPVDTDADLQGGPVDQARAFLMQGVCVKVCPFLDSSTFDSLSNAGFNFQNGGLSTNVLDGIKVYTYGTDHKTNHTVFAPSFHFTTYTSSELYRRCVPEGLKKVANMTYLLANVPGAQDTGDFFNRGINETASAWRVIVIAAVVALVLCFVYTFLLRLFVKPLVYLCLFFTGAAIFGIAWLLWAHSEKMADANRNKDDAEDEEYEDAYRYTSYIVWGLCAVYFLVLIVMRKRINEAIAMIKIAGRVIKSSPIMMLVPPFCAMLVVAVAIWCIFVGVYIYTADSFDHGINATFTVPDLGALSTSDLSNVFNRTINGKTVSFINATGSANNADETRKQLLIYDLFGFLWTMGFVNAIGYMVLAFCTVFWYFSDLEDDKKAIPVGGVCRAMKWTLVYHTGTLAFGSFIIAVIQMLRIWMRYVAAKCEAIKNNPGAALVLYIAECCVACFERVIKLISKNAYIMTCITNKAFLCAAKAAINIILDNAATIACLNLIAEFVMGLGKILIICGTVLLSYWMMNNEDLAPDVDTRIMPLIIIAFITYFITSVFFNVYQTCIDAAFICFHHDIKVNASKGTYFFPKELEDQMKGYDVDKKAQEWKAKQDGRVNPSNPK